MSEDLTTKLPKSDSEKLTSILDTVQSFEGRIHSLEEEVKAKTLRHPAHLGEAGCRHRTIKRFSSGWRRVRLSVHLRDLSRESVALNDAVLQIHVDLRDIDERLLALEGTHNPQNSST